MLTLIFHSISLKVVWTSATETKTELLIAPVSICTPEDYILTLLRPRKCTAAWFTVCHYCIPLPLVIGLILLDILIGELTHYICNARLFTFLLRFFHPTSIIPRNRPQKNILGLLNSQRLFELCTFTSPDWKYESLFNIMSAYRPQLPITNYEWIWTWSIEVSSVPRSYTQQNHKHISHLSLSSPGLTYRTISWKKKKKVLMTFSARSTLTENEEWKYHLCIIEAVMINWSH